MQRAALQISNYSSRYPSDWDSSRFGVRRDFRWSMLRGVVRDEFEETE